MSSPPPYVVPAPPLVPPRASLVASAGPNAAQGVDPHWVNGLTFAPEVGSHAHDWWDCEGEGDDAPDDKDPTEWIDIPSVPVFQPWWVWGSDHCTSLQWQSRDGKGRATRMLAARESLSIAQELWNGTVATAAGFATPFLQDAGLNDLGGPTPLVYALGELQQAMASASPGRGMIHMSQRAATLYLSALAIRREGDLLLDAFDNIIVADAGYDGSGPSGAGGGDTEYIYGTDVVQVWRGDIDIYGDPETAESAVYVDNTVAWVAERPVCYLFSPVCQIGIEADLCTPCCTPTVEIG